MKRLLIPFVLMPSMLAAAPDLSVPGGRVTFTEAAEEREIALPDQAWAATAEIRTASGMTQRTAWELVDSTATPLQLVQPLRAALEAEGYSVVFDCAAVSCGGYDFRFTLALAPPPAMFVDLADYHYFLAQKGQSEVAVLASRSGGRGYVHVTALGEAANVEVEDTTVIEPPALERPVPEMTSGGSAPIVQPGNIAGLLESTGRVPLDGLSFASGSTDVSENGSGDLAALADWLSSRPGSRIALVGHTDAVGGLEGNTRLSKARATAVRQVLVERYGVNPTQLDAEGAGYLAPRSPNRTAEGRDRNRRVEAVLLDTE